MSLQIEHPYYCDTGNYFATGCHHKWASWAEFLAEFGETDRDLNLVWRWDWKRPDPDNADEPATLLVFVMLQRKACNISHEIVVTDADEPAVREFLAVCWKTIQALWAPFGGTP